MCSTLSFQWKHSYRDVGRKKCHFCLSFCSVFIVVWAALVVNTVISKGPVIFLKLSESLEGQFDGYLYPSIEDKDNGKFFVNYTAAMKVLNNTGKTYNLSPRKEFEYAKAGSSYPIDRREGIQSKDEWFMEEEANYIKTSDGKNTVPSLDELNQKF